MIHSRPSSGHSRRGSGRIWGTKVQILQKGCIQRFGIQTPKKPQKLILPSIFSTRICCQCTVSLVFIFRVINFLFIHIPCQPPKKNHLQTSQASQHTVQLQLRNPALVLDPLPRVGPGAPLGEAPRVLESLWLSILDFRAFVSQEPGLAFLWVKGPGKGAPWRDPTRLKPAGSQAGANPPKPVSLPSGLPLHPLNLDIPKLRIH